MLDVELDALTAANEAVGVLRLPLTHLAPAWDAIDEVVAAVEAFLDGTAPCPVLRIPTGDLGDEFEAALDADSDADPEGS